MSEKKATELIYSSAGGARSGGSVSFAFSILRSERRFEAWI